MNKETFLSELYSRIQGLPAEDINKTLDYYIEMIDDRVEDGMSEEEAVAALGSLDYIVSQVFSSVSLPKIVRENVKKHRGLKGWEIALLILGFPLWFPLIITAGALIFSAYVVLWSLVVAFFAVVISFGAAAVCSLISVFIFIPTPARAAVFFGATLVFAGLCSIGILIAVQVTRGVCFLGKKILLGIKFCFTGRRGA